MSQLDVIFWMLIGQMLLTALLVITIHLHLIDIEEQLKRKAELMK